MTDRMIRTGLSSGTLVHVRQGVVLGAEHWPSDDAGRHLVRARAEQAANEDSVLSHQSAALVWQIPAPGFRPWSALPVSVTLPRSGHSSHSGRAVHHLVDVPPAQVTRDPHGCPTTTPGRTAVDLALGLDLPQSLAVLDGAARIICASMLAGIRRRDYSNPRLERAAVELMDQAAGPRAPRELRRAIGIVCAGRESAAESVSAGHILDSGLPVPRFQAELVTAAGTYFADCLWEEPRLVGECDGAMKYEDAQAYVREKRREQALRDAGYAVVRWEAKEAVLRPELMLDRIARALGL
ncbi:MAG TPA: DUF559 domain-containing protein [Propionibacteriaceae bacterium]|nr:DUF559 domain-containing protein [Propionibacteriaceae bacterium]